MLAAADGIMISEGTPYGTIYVGNELTKVVKGYQINMNGNGVTPIPPGIHAFTPSTTMTQQYSTYVDALAFTNGVTGSVLLQGNIVALSDVPQSAFDVTTDGAARTALINHISNTSNWPLSNSLWLHAKMALNTGVQFYTGRDYNIQFKWVTADQSYVIARYESTCQCVKLVEVRDSAGNLIATDSVTPIPVNYDSYLQPGASSRPDYSRGMGWLNMQGILITTGSGTRIRTPIVIVGNTVQTP